MSVISLTYQYLYKNYQEFTTSNYFTASQGNTIDDVEIIQAPPDYVEYDYDNGHIEMTLRGNYSKTMIAFKVVLKFAYLDTVGDLYYETHSFCIYQDCVHTLGFVANGIGVDTGIDGYERVYYKVYKGIYSTDTVMGSGTLYKAPNDDILKFNLTELVIPFCSDIPYIYENEYDVYDEDYFKFYVYLFSDDGYNNIITSYVLSPLNDYSYENDYVEAKVYKLYYPISNKISNNTLFAKTLVNNSNSAYTFNVVINGETFVSYTIDAKTVGVVYPHIISSNITSYIIDGVQYKVEKCSPPFVILYLNSAGGWESLCVYGNFQINEEYERMQYVDRSKNKKTYKTTTQKRYVINTGWIPDENSVNISNLYGSQRVRLFANDIFIDGYIENSTTEIKTFEHNGRKLNNYTFTFVEENKKIRR